MEKENRAGLWQWWKRKEDPLQIISAIPTCSLQLKSRTLLKHEYNCTGCFFHLVRTMYQPQLAIVLSEYAIMPETHLPHTQSRNVINKNIFVHSFSSYTRTVYYYLIFAQNLLYIGFVLSLSTTHKVSLHSTSGPIFYFTIVC